MRQKEAPERRNKTEERKLRIDYRKILEETEQKKLEILEGDSELLIEEILESNKLFERVKSTQDATLDSRLLKLSAFIAENKTRKMQNDISRFDMDEYIRKIKHKLYGSNAEEKEAIGVPADWSKLGKIASKYTARAPGLCAVSGRLRIEGGATQRRRRRAAEENGANSNQRAANRHVPGETKTINELDMDGYKAKRQQENETTKQIYILHKTLTQLGREVSLFEFVINPQSFSETVENIFYLSFLIREGKVVMDTSSGVPMIAACEQPQQSDYTKGLKKKQLIFDIDMNTWKKLIQVYGIKKCIIPSRS